MNELKAEIRKLDNCNGDADCTKKLYKVLTVKPNEMMLEELIEREDLHNAKLSDIHNVCSQVEREASKSFKETDWSDVANRTPVKLRGKEPEEGPTASFTDDAGNDGFR
jgi:hypothetical protein